MNIVSYNNTFISSESFNFSSTDRAARYGDGIFETMIYIYKKVRLWDYHFERLENGMKILQMKFPDNFKKLLLESMYNLLKNNQLENSICKIRMQVWRKEGGLYTPENNEINLLIEASVIPNQEYKYIHLEICETTKLSYSPYSHLKTCNSIPYVIASIERKNKKVDDLLLLNMDEKIAEATSSNIFWYKNGQWFTPSLFTGCLAGTMRKYCILNLKNVQEVETKIDSILNADAVFICNALGIKPVKSFLQTQFDTSNEAYTFIKNLAHQIEQLNFEN
jgi:branched-subunit amino acid aminotransferase/4-amino-4-deoxychorismate lyase